MKIKTFLVLFALLAFSTGLASAEQQVAPSYAKTEIFFDDFLVDGTLDTSIWSFGGNSAGRSYSIQNGILQLNSGTTNGGGSWIITNSKYDPSAYEALTLEVRARWPEWGNLSFWTPADGSAYFSRNRLTDEFNASFLFDEPGYTPDVTNIPGIDTNEWHTYKITLSGDVAVINIDGIRKHIQTTDVTQNPMNVRITPGSKGSQHTMEVDYVRMTATTEPSCEITSELVFCDNFGDGELATNPEWQIVRPTAPFSATTGELVGHGVNVDQSDRFLHTYNVTGLSIAAPDYLEFKYRGKLLADGEDGVVQNGRGILFAVVGPTGRYDLNMQNGYTSGFPTDQNAFSIVHHTPGQSPQNLISSNTAQNSIAPPVDGTYYEVRAVREAGAWKLYVDGTLIGSALEPFPLTEITQIHMPFVGSVAIDDIEVVVYPDLGPPCDVSPQVVFCEDYNDGELDNNPSWVYTNTAWNIINGQLHSDGLIQDSSDRYRTIYESVFSQQIQAPDYLEMSYSGVLKSVGNPQIGRGIQLSLIGEGEVYQLRLQNSVTSGASVNFFSFALSYTGNGFFDLITSNFAPEYDQEYEIKAIRENGVWTLYVDSQVIDSAADPVGMTVLDKYFFDVVGSVVIDDVVLKVGQPNTPPVADAGPDLVGNEGELLTFDGSGSYDPDAGDSIASYDWVFSDAGMENGETVNYAFADNGAYTATLTVDDTHAESDNDVADVTVNNVAPSVGAIAPSFLPITVGNVVSFNASFTDPGTADTHTASWDWGDTFSDPGTVTQGAGSGSVDDSHTFAQPGTYTVTLTVTDDDGDSSVTTLEVNVNFSLDGFVALGYEGIYLKQGATIVSGDVGANVSSSGPYLAGSQEVTVGKSVTIQSAASQVMGDSIKIKQNGEVYDTFYNDLSNNGTVLGTEYTPLALPLVESFPALPAFSPGTEEIFVAQGDSHTIDSGSYGLLDANKNTTLIFTGGVYDFEEWDVGQDVDVLFQAPSEIRIAGKLHVDQNSYVGPDSGSGLSAKDIVIYVNGINGNNGNLGATAKAAKFGLHSTVFVNVYVPNGTLWLRQGSNSTGAFLAKWMIVGINATVTLESGW